MTQMNWLVVYPEILLLVAACVIALVDLWVTDPQRGLTFKAWWCPTPWGICWRCAQPWP